MISIAPTMRNLLKLTPTVAVFCLFFLLYHITLVASSTPPRNVPVEDITVAVPLQISRRISMGATGLGIFSPSTFPKNLIISNLIPLKPQMKASPQKPPTPAHAYLILNSRTYFRSLLARNSFGCTLTLPLTQDLSLRPFSLSKQVRSPYIETSPLLAFL